MFACIQPPVKKRTFGQKYFRMMRMCVHSLLQTGFPVKKIICVVADDSHARRMEKQFGVNIRLCNTMPKEIEAACRHNPQNYYFYKPVAYYNAVPDTINNSVMAFCDVDVLFYNNPTNLITEQQVDVWSARGSRLPRRCGDYIPKRDYKDLSKYFNKAGNGSIASLVLKYNIPTPKEILCSAFVAIKPAVYSCVIKTWYEMCLEVIVRNDHTEVVGRPDLIGGDQEVLSAAVWRLGISFARSTKKYTRKIVKQYGGSERKSEMQRDFKKRFKVSV